jgi:biotin transport system substrate-specific component
MNSVQEHIFSRLNQETSMATKFTLRDLSRIAIFAAIIAALSIPGEIPLATGVPITLQTLGVMLAGVVLGGYRGALAVLVFEILALAGLPILADHTGGIANFTTSPAAGFLIAWIPGAFVVGLIARSANGKPSVIRTILGSIVGGIVVIYAIGIPVMAQILGVDLVTATGYASIYLIGDSIKVALTAIIVYALYRAYPKALKN